ncbi:MAG: AraC family transcriptional regulator [Ferruginibacter sp.]|uniref:helix-turn-helix domain-containing protein n=1 Tax=Ferruginibacter sp. TaxID=1940288 RepID=UPI0026598EA9|nr:AraC family transcriptional regulator [Ferruginibacter sp.]MDB5276557.1 AraC family transcriptional regulator [Ferruginibacter sp.]
MLQQESFRQCGAGASLFNFGMNSIAFHGEAAVRHYSFDQGQSDRVFCDDNILLVTVNGKLNLNYGKSSYAVGKNQMAFLKNNLMVDFRAETDQQKGGKVEFIVFLISHELIKEFTKITQLSQIINDEASEIFVSLQNSHLQLYINSLTPYIGDAAKIEGSLLRIKLLELLFCLASTDTQMLDLLLNLKKSYRPNITTVVEDNLLNPLSINQLARLCGRSLSSFRRDFISTYNMPPSQWIRERRLRKAKEFLVTTRMTVTDICYTLGFENIAHFSRLFKSEFGHSPSEYRMQLASA